MTATTDQHPRLITRSLAEYPARVPAPVEKPSADEWFLVTQVRFYKALIAVFDLPLKNNAALYTAPYVRFEVDRFETFIHGRLVANSHEVGPVTRAMNSVTDDLEWQVVVDDVLLTECDAESVYAHWRQHGQHRTAVIGSLADLADKARLVDEVEANYQRASFHLHREAPELRESER